MESHGESSRAWENLILSNPLLLLHRESIANNISVDRFQDNNSTLKLVIYSFKCLSACMMSLDPNQHTCYCPHFRNKETEIRIVTKSVKWCSHTRS